MTELRDYQIQLIDASMSVGALKFGSFTLKSGRLSPYFFNAGLLSSGSILSIVASAYARTIAESGIEFDVLFGPAYKGIALAACTALILSRDYHLEIGFAYDRKEVKDHGEGGVLVGVPVQGKRVLILDDVMTSGMAVRLSLGTIQAVGGNVVGVVQLLDRQEVGKDGGSTVMETEKLVGGSGRVKSILKMRDLMAWLEKAGKTEELDKMTIYWEQYGIKS